MSAPSWIGLAALATAASLGVAYRLFRGGSIAWPAACVSLLVLGTLMVMGRSHRPTSDCVIVADQPFAPGRIDELRKLVTRLRGEHVARIALIELGPRTEGMLAWAPVTRDPSDLAIEPTRARSGTLDLACRWALDHLAQPRGWRAVLDVLAGRSGRLVVTVSDPVLWTEKLGPVPVDDLLRRAREREVVCDVIELASTPMTPSVEISLPLDIPAARSLHESRAAASVSVRSPALTAFKGQAVPVEVSGSLNDSEARLEKHAARGIVHSSGVLTFPLPLAAFRPPGRPSAPVEFAPGFVLCELSASISLGTAGLAAEGRGYLPVRAATVAIVCGGGSGPDRLRQPGLLVPAGPAGPDEVAAIRALAGPLLGPRAGPLARFEFLTPAAFLARLQPGGDPPQVAVLHELPASFWSGKTGGKYDVDRLIEAVRVGGLHLLVVDPPAVPSDPALADRLRTILPAFASADERRAVPSPVPPPPRTADRTPILNLVFDYGRFGRLASTPFESDATHAGSGRSIEPALAAQKLAAEALLEGLVDDAGKRLAPGRLVASSSGELRYRPDPSRPDRIVVRVARRLSTPPDDQLDSLIFPSTMELRVASLFERVPSFAFERKKSGLEAAPAAGPYPAEDPCFTPNQAVVLFVGQVPQPIATASRPGQAQPAIVYQLGDETKRRSYRANADGAIANCLMRGMSVAVVQLALPPYQRGLESRTLKAPGGQPNRLARFSATPEFVLTSQLRADLEILAASGSFLLTKVEAEGRLVRSGRAGPLFGSVDLTAPGHRAVAERTGRELAARLRPLFGSPRLAMAAAVSAHDRLVDERIGPVIGPHRLAELQADERRLEDEWPASARRAGPWRHRTLEPNDRLPTTASDLIHAVDLGPALPRIKPQPLVRAAVVGNAHVAVFAYSPFERMEPGWDGPDALNEPAARQAHADHFGRQRILDAAYLLARLAPLPTDAPRVREIRARDARGDLEIVAEFLPNQAAPPSFWTPTLVDVADPSLRSGPLELVDVSFERGEIRFRATAAALAPAFQDDRPSSFQVDFGATVSRAPRFLIRRPAPSAWIALDAYQSVATLAEYSGGVVGGPDDLRAHARSLRLVWQSCTLAALAAIALTRGWWRWRQLVRNRRAPGVLEHVFVIQDLDVTGLVEQAGYIASPPRSGRRNGSLEQVGRITRRDKLRSVRRTALARLGLGVATDLPVERRIRPRSARVDLVVNLGPSMRTRGAWATRPKLRLAAVVVQAVAELGWLYGAEVRVIAIGLSGGPREWGPQPARDRENGLLETILEWAAEPAERQPTLTELDTVPGTLLVLVSDFLSEDVPSLLALAEEACEEQGRLAAIGVRTVEDAEQVGVGYTWPGVVLDRSALTPDDLAAVIDARLDSARRAFEDGGHAFAMVDSRMTGEAILAEIETSGLAGKLG